MPIPEFLRDPMWGSIGAFAGLAALIIAIVALFIQRKRKQASYEIITSTPVLSTEEQLSDKLQILFEGQPVTDVQLLEVKIINSGNLPILSTDFESPVVFVFGDEARVLSAEIMETNPRGLEIATTIVSGAVMLSRSLLNPGDSITIRMLVSGYQRRISIKCRVVGLSKIRQINGDSPFGVAFLYQLLAVAFMMAFAFHRDSGRPKLPAKPLTALDFVLFVLALLFGILFAVRASKLRTLQRLTSALAKDLLVFLRAKGTKR